MADTGIVDVLSAAFGGVLKMLTGKKYPQNVRALRMLVEELLRPIFDNNGLETMSGLQQILNDVASHSRTGRLWVDCLIRPIFTILKYIRAEREADWALHLDSRRDASLFFAAGHVHYARYALYYLRSMQGLPADIQKKFVKRQHTMHHSTATGLFNRIWSDMAIETTFMRYGHSKNKVQLIDLIMADLIEHKETFQQHTLFVTGSDPVPVEIENGRVGMRVDMTTMQKKSDTLIIQQVAHVTDSTVLVVADDTDIFILLLYFCHRGDISCKVLVVSPVQGRAVLDINAAVEVHKLIIPDLLAAHGLKYLPLDCYMLMVLSYLLELSSIKLYIMYQMFLCFLRESHMLAFRLDEEEIIDRKDSAGGRTPIVPYNKSVYKYCMEMSAKYTFS
ncbi:hypothetical protein GQR58_021089 [Nymphon striatum]|nr:hypothetical protein GQR58_021089 [Nymphon striatum]